MSMQRRVIQILLSILSTLFLISITQFLLGSSSTSLSSPYQPFHSYHDGEPNYWDWDTATRFRTSRIVKTNDDELCASFPSYLLSSVQVVLKIGASESAERLDISTSYATRCISNLIIVSDREFELNGHHVHDVLADLLPVFRATAPDFDAYESLQWDDGSFDNGMGWKLDRYKFLPMVERAKKMNPVAEWFVFLESDTYFVWDNLFRMLDQFDPSTPLYFGSPSPGHRTQDGETTWFAYGGAGFVLSRAAVTILLRRETGRHGEFIQPSLTIQDENLVKGECCGDSLLGWTLYQKGVKLSGMWPMFNPHPLHSIPFDNAYWCQPVISMHKNLLTDMAGLVKWENERNRTYPLLYADLFEYTKMGALETKEDWDNGDWGGFFEPPESPAHSSLNACRKACHENDRCLSFTYNSSGRCVFVPAMRLGSKKNLSEARLSAGWDTEKIKNWRASHQCQRPMWMKPSIKRIF